nr:hypothetical protein CFP56_22128 [Quercus suber]
MVAFVIEQNCRTSLMPKRQPCLPTTFNDTVAADDDDVKVEGSSAASHVERYKRRKRDSRDIDVGGIPVRSTSDMTVTFIDTVIGVLDRLRCGSEVAQQTGPPSCDSQFTDGPAGRLRNWEWERESCFEIAESCQRLPCSGLISGAPPSTPCSAVTGRSCIRVAADCAPPARIFRSAKRWRMLTSPALVLSMMLGLNFTHLLLINVTSPSPGGSRWRCHPLVPGSSRCQQGPVTPSHGDAGLTDSVVQRHDPIRDPVCQSNNVWFVQSGIGRRQHHCGHSRSPMLACCRVRARTGDNGTADATTPARVFSIEMDISPLLSAMILNPSRSV